MERKLLYPSVIVVGVSLVLIAFTITPIFFKLPPIPILGAASSFILQDEENRTVILNNYSNTVIFVGFIYTNCVDLEWCPLTTQKMANLQDKLLASGYTRTDFSLITISFDWKYDNPARMKSYGSTYGADFTSWSFLSGNETRIEAVTADYGLFFLNSTDPDNIYLVHNLREFILDKNGFIRAEYTKNDTWSVEQAYNIIVRLIQGE